MPRLPVWAAGQGTLFDAPQGRRTRSNLVLDSGHVALSAVNPVTILSRFSTPEEGAE
jgi:regulator of extracellular matrix RemA (YlzA/DUF370 family)